MKQGKANQKLVIGTIIGLALLIVLVSGLSFSVVTTQQTAEVTPLITQTLVQQGTKFTIPFNVHSATGGDFYVEAGLIQSSRQAFAITTVQGSKCDPATQYAGDFITLAPGETRKINAVLTDYGLTGTYNIVIGAYSGCGGITYDDAVLSEGAIIVPAEQTPVVVTDTGVFGGQLSGFSVKPATGTTFKVGETIKIKGTFKATGDGKYYIEGGLNPYTVPALSIVDLSSSISQCDAKETHAGTWANLKKGDIANVDFSVVTKTAGNYNAVLTATDGCYIPTHTPNHAGETQVQVIKVESGALPPTPPPPTVNKSLAECEDGQTSERKCESTNAGLTGTQKLVCGGGAWNVQSGECKQKSELCLEYQTFRDNKCSFALGNVFTNAGLTSFAKNNPITFLFVLVIVGTGLWYGITQLKKRRK